MAISYGIALQNGPTFWPVKQCDETLSYAWDKGAWLLANGSDSIASVTATIPWTISGDAQVVALNVVGSVITVRITGGLPGETYACSISGTTTLGNAFADTLFLPINAPFTEAGEPAPTPPETVAATLTWPSGDLPPPTGPFLPIDGSVPMTGPLNAPMMIVQQGLSSGLGINVYPSDEQGDFNYLQDGFAALLTQDPELGGLYLFAFPSGAADAAVNYTVQFSFLQDGSFAAGGGVYGKDDRTLGMYDDGHGNRYLQFNLGRGWCYPYGGPLKWLANGNAVFSIDDEGDVVVAGSLSLPNGSSLAPALQIGAADGTGFWRAPGNIVGLVVSGAFVAAFAPALAQFYQPLNMLTNRIQQLGDATTATDALNMRTADARYAPITLADEVAALRAELTTLRATISTRPQ
jgi:hypothetical protein